MCPRTRASVLGTGGRFGLPFTLRFGLEEARQENPVEREGPAPFAAIPRVRAVCGLFLRNRPFQHTDPRIPESRRERRRHRQVLTPATCPFRQPAIIRHFASRHPSLDAIVSPSTIASRLRSTLTCVELRSGSEVVLPCLTRRVSNFITLALPARRGVKLPKFVCAMGQDFHSEEFGDKFLAPVPNVSR